MGRSYHKGKAVKIEDEDMKKLHQRVIEITEVDDCYFAQNGLPTQNQGWKLHVSLSRVEEYQFCAYFILPELISLAMPFKIVLPQYMEHMNSNEVQKGKILTIYLKKNFEHNLSGLCPNAKLFFQQKPELMVSTDLYLGGRVFARYGAFYGEVVKDRYGIEYKDERAEGKYKPAFIKEDISFQQIFF